jgi:hypothetical protein
MTEVLIYILFFSLSDTKLIISVFYYLMISLKISFCALFNAGFLLSCEYIISGLNTLF